MVPCTMAWISLHLHHGSPIYSPETDQLLVTASGRWSEAANAMGETGCWFAIRYNEGGPHVRWRLRADEARSARTLRAMRSFGEHWAQQGEGRRVVEVPYAQELERYGGHSWMEEAERLFHVSTSLAVEQLPLVALENRRRLGVALVATLTLLRTLAQHASSLRDLATQYSEGYLRIVQQEQDGQDALREAFMRSASAQRERLMAMVPQLCEALDAGDLPSAGLNSYASASRRYVAMLIRAAQEGTLSSPPRQSPGESAVSIVFSQVHMTNNRLGLSLWEEAFVASAIACVHD